MIAYFTPATGVAGGLLIGAAAASLLLLSGDILGASGIFNSLVLTPKEALTDPCSAWKLVFLSIFGMVSLLVGPYFAQDDRLGEDPGIPVVSPAGYCLAGLLVGFGTRLGNGCTSGHGICGMARLSKRSITAVATFMLSAVAMAALTAPQNEWASDATEWLRTSAPAPDLYNPAIGSTVVAVVAVIPMLVALRNLLVRKNTTTETAKDVEGGTTAADGANQQPTEAFDVAIEAYDEDPEKQQRSADSADATSGNTDDNADDSNCSSTDPHHDAVMKLPSGSLAALLFALGLAISGMIQPAKVLGFLNLFLLGEGTYDPTLLTVMMSGCAVSFAAYQFVPGHHLFSCLPQRSKPFLTSQFSVPCHQIIDWKLLVGAISFGCGWGLAGLCPGPALFLAATGTKPVLYYYWPLYIVGSFVANILKERF